jgi:hypothetical protein
VTDLDLLSGHLAAALAELAEGCGRAADVARKLTAAKVTGVRGATCGCPVGVWLTLRIHPPPDWDIHVGIDITEVLAPAPEGGTAVMADAVTPLAVASFAVAFDDEHEFPALDATAATAR